MGEGLKAEGGRMSDNSDGRDVTRQIPHLFFRTTGSPASKSPASGSGGPASGGAGATAAPGGGASNAGSAEPRTPTAGPQNKQLQNVKGEHPSVSRSRSDSLTRLSRAESRGEVEVSRGTCGKELRNGGGGVNWSVFFFGD